MGAERRAGEISVGEELRKERRELLKDPDQTTGRLRTIPLFEGLSTVQLLNLLRICSKRIYNRGDIIHSAGDEPASMFVLVQGRLRMLFSNGTVLDNYNPPGIVGEVGFITGERRTSTLVAATDCIVLSFGKEEIFRLFKEDGDMWTKVLTQIIRDLAGKLRQENEILESLQRIRSFQVL
jgi:CRP/FNR family transcriptional regulator, cyclic AMP receptor protein